MYASDTVLYVGFFIFLISILPPFIHLIRVKGEVFKLNNYTNSTAIKNIAVLLPVRDESLVIADKIDEIFNIDNNGFEINLLIIDSGSDDNTAKIASEYLVNKYPNKKYEVLTFDQPGKSFAVSKGFELLNEEIIIMMDAEAILNKQTFNDIIEYFKDPKVGAVCGHQMSKKGGYRGFFNRLRIGESAMDSSTVFEGSICAFRKSAVSKNPLINNINADDTQLALDVRRNGFRSIMAPNIQFNEPVITNYDEYFRKVRRAQGLIRVLFANKDMIFGNGKFSIFFASTFYFYIMMPWLNVLSFILIIYPLLSMIFGATLYTDLVFFGYISGLFLCLCLKFSREYFLGIFSLLQAQITYIFGYSLHIWKPNQNIRKNRKEIKLDK